MGRPVLVAATFARLSGFDVHAPPTIPAADDDVKYAAIHDRLTALARILSNPIEIRRILEARMQRYESQSNFARKYYGQGVAEGLEHGLRAAVVALARTRLGAPSDDESATIEAASNPHVLTELVTSLGQASSALEARATLDRALAR